MGLFKGFGGGRRDPAERFYNRRLLRPVYLNPMSAKISLASSSDPVPASAISPVSEIIDELRAGRMVILVDEEDRENEGDLVMAAEFVTPEAINFMVTHGRGLVCLTLTEERCEQLELPLMSARNGTAYGTNLTVSIEAAEGVETGISVADRARTVQVAVARDAKATDLVQPGHIFPLKAVAGGVLVRAGHTEAGCDLTRMAGLTPAAVICEILKADGTMARLPDLIEYGHTHKLKIVTVILYSLAMTHSRPQQLTQTGQMHQASIYYSQIKKARMLGLSLALVLSSCIVNRLMY